MRYYLAAAAALALQISASHAETIVALSADNVLATFDTATGKVVDRTKIEGFGPIVGIDVRPSDGLLYALAADGNVAVIDPSDGTVTPKSQLNIPLPNDKISVDFNPVADRMRIIGGDGTNLRANVDDGKVIQDKPLSFAATDAASGLPPRVIAGAYVNSVKGAKETTLYDIDGSLSDLVKQAPPNDGILTVVGTPGVDSDTIGFDIVTDAAGVNKALLLAERTLYSVDLTNGQTIVLKKIAGLKGDIFDMAILPAGDMKQAASDMKMMGGMDRQADMAPAAMQKDGYLPPKMKPMADDLKKPAAKEKMAYGAQQDAYMTPKAKKSGGYAQQADYDDDQDARPVKKMKRRGAYCNRPVHY